MKITLADVTVEIPNADQDGIHTFELSDSFWALWHKEKGLCKAFGFYIEKRRHRWVGIYKPYARFAEGSKRLRLTTQNDADGKKRTLFLEQKRTHNPMRTVCLGVDPGIANTGLSDCGAYPQ